MATLAKRIDGVAEKKLGKALKDAGYSFDNRTKVWSCTGEGEEPLDRNIFDYVNPSSHVTHVNMKTSVHKSEKDVQPNSSISEIYVNSSSPSSETDVKSECIKKELTSHEGEMDVEEDYSRLMYEELKAIRGLLQVGEPKVKGIAHDSLLERIGGLNKSSNKVRKTIVIDENVAKLLDQLAEEKRVNKSDLLEVALLDLSERYN